MAVWTRGGESEEREEPNDSNPGHGKELLGVVE